MTPQLRHNFQASQAVHGADDIRATQFSDRSILLALVVPKLILLFTTGDWSAHLILLTLVSM